ncbi:aminotransferase class V-fold PLP-dependent enzyme [Archangium sp.]|uniref:aminotransferase class V-fold PLP-dependent enzyme n=1 Tax=Archangium sp. TaxID=1872627 RepID=UPI002869F0DF|nr:aminotransferase class V-fold PLP-dependent enzyme [Archangium sp.]
MSHYKELIAAQGSVYLNTGAAGPMPLRAYEVIRQETEHEFRFGRVEQRGKKKFFEALEHLRSLLGALLGCDPARVAVTSTTSEGVSIVLWGLPLSAGDHVLTTTFEHLGATASLSTLCKVRGVEASFYQPEQDEFDVERFFSLVTDRTRLILISHVSWTSGRLIPIQDICERAHERGIRVLVDGAQSVGAIPVDVVALGADFYAFPGQKWLLGPEGVGALYVSPAGLEALQQTYAGVFSFAKHDGRVAFVPKDGSARFEIGTRFRSLLRAWATSLEWLGTEVGWSTVFDQTEANAKRLHALLAEHTGLRPVVAERGSGLTALELPPHLDATQFVAALDEKRIFVRTVPGRNRMRVSTGFFNSESDFQALLEELRAAKP